MEEIIGTYEGNLAGYYMSEGTFQQDG